MDTEQGLMSGHEELLKKFLEITWSKVTKLDEYGDENWEAMHKEIWVVIGKVGYIELGLFSKDIASLRIKNPIKTTRNERTGTHSTDKRTREARPFASRARMLEKYLEDAFRAYHAKRRAETKASLAVNQTSTDDRGAV